MIRALALTLLASLFACAAVAQEFSGRARVDMAQSEVRDISGGLRLDLALSQPVPWRLFTLDGPPRLVLDFREVDWSGVTRAALLNADRATDLSFGPLRPGWSRLVVVLDGPQRVTSAGMTTDQTAGTARLRVDLAPTDADSFAASAGAPDDPFAPMPALPAPTPEDGPVTVMIDPGHGGLDPGAQSGEVDEAVLMLQLGIELAEALNRTGQIRALLTRQDDSFVPLAERMTRARAARADLLISLHADALAEDAAFGASVYTLSAEGLDRASQRMAERHERGDLLAGLDLTGQDDRVATVLMDLARQDSGPASDRFAATLVAAMKDAGVRINSRPRRTANLAVLNAADFASVLVEAGFLTDAKDRETLSSAAGRAPLVAAITNAVLTWADDEAARAPLKRQ